MDNFLGPIGQREEMIEYCEGKFRAKFGKKFRFSHTQRTLLQTIEKSVAVMDCVAGAGKTTMLLSLAMWAIKRKEKGAEGCLHYVCETQELADDFYVRLVELMQSNDGIFPLGCVPSAF